METITESQVDNEFLVDGYNHGGNGNLFVDYCLPHISGNASLGITGVGVFKDEDEFLNWADISNVDKSHRLFFIQYKKIKLAI